MAGARGVPERLQTESINQTDRNSWLDFPAGATRSAPIEHVITTHLRPLPLTFELGFPCQGSRPAIEGRLNMADEIEDSENLTDHYLAVVGERSTNMQIFMIRP
jgi:hypothetical protein